MPPLEQGRQETLLNIEIGFVARNGLDGPIKGDDFPA